MIKIFKFFRKRLDYVLGFTAGPALFAAILYSVEHFEAAFIAIGHTSDCRAFLYFAAC